jgi:arsenate reductase
MITMYAIKNCDTVKKACLFLEKNGVEFDFVDFKKTAPTKEQILRWKTFFKGLPHNSKGPTYRKNKEIYESLSEEQKIQFLIENTSMIKRPIVEKNKKVLAMGFDEEAYRSWIN